MDKREIAEQLKAPFDPACISWRVGATNGDKTSGIALAYIDARDVMQRLDDVFGLDWQCRYSHTGAKTVCDIGACIDGTWIWRAGGAGDTDVEAEKGALSDAFKRAAVLWGIGQYLYRLENKWVPIKAQGKSYVLDGKPSLPNWALPEKLDYSEDEIIAETDIWNATKQAMLDSGMGTDNPRFSDEWYRRPSNLRTAIKARMDSLAKQLAADAQSHMQSLKETK